MRNGTGTRSWPRAVGVGILGGVLAAALVLILVALPLFFFALAAEPDQGTGRPFVRTGLVDVALPLAAVVGLIAGPLAARWHLRGGRLGGESGEDQERWGG